MSDLPQDVVIMVIPQVGVTSLDMEIDELDLALTCANTGSGVGFTVPCQFGNDSPDSAGTLTPITFDAMAVGGPFNTPPAGAVPCDLDDTTPAVDNGDGTVTFFFDPSSEELITQDGCWFEYVATVEDKGTDTTPLRLTQIGLTQGNCDDDGDPLTGSAQGSLAISLEEPICIPEIDVCVAVDTDNDGSFDDEECIPDNIGLNDNGDSGPKNYRFFVNGDVASTSDDLEGCVVQECDSSGENCQDVTDPFALNTTEGETEVYTADDSCSDQRDERTYRISCDICDGFDIPTTTDPDTASVECVDCLVNIEKTSTCDTGANYGESCIGWANMAEEDWETQYRYEITNTGDVDLGSCTLTDTLVNITDQNIGDIDVNGGTVTEFSGYDECTDIDGNNLAIVDCLCLPFVDGAPLQIGDNVVGENTDGPTFGECNATDQDDAEIMCQTVNLGISKVCDEQDAEGDNAVTVTIMNAGTAPMENCSVTDTLADLTCEGVADTSDFDIPAETNIQCTGTVSGLEVNTLNEASISCTIAGTDKPVNPEPATDMCEVPGDCLTRTPGFWGTHPHVAADFLPQTVCGVELTETDAGEEGSTTEDMCVNGKEAKENYTSMTQLQLYRQCTAAALNLAASIEGGGSCDRVIGEVFDECCSFVEEDSLCGNAPTEEEIAASGCIEDLDEFNNSEDTLDPFGPFLSPGPANSQECREASHNGFLNDRNHGPKSGGGPQAALGGSSSETR